MHLFFLQICYFHFPNFCINVQDCNATKMLSIELHVFVGEIPFRDLTLRQMAYYGPNFNPAILAQEVSLGFRVSTESIRLRALISILY